MNGRERFTAVMQYRSADRLPRFEEGIREEVQAQWEKEGLPVDVDLEEWFEYDVREEVEFNLEPFPKLNSFPVSAAEMAEYPSHLNPDDAVRRLENFVERAAGWQNRTYPLILRVQRGFFLSMGVENWQHFQDIIALTKDDPRLVARVLQLQ